MPWPSLVRMVLPSALTCPNDDTIVTAPTPPAIVEGGKLGDRLIIDALADKYLLSLPIERQCLRWSGTGVDIAPQTLGRSVAKAVREYVEHYHLERNHQGRGNQLLQRAPPSSRSMASPIQRRTRLGGILSFYHRKAA